MVQAIVFKELREIRLFAAAALGFYCVYLSQLTGHGNQVLSALLGWLPFGSVDAAIVPFVHDGFVTVYFFIGCALAIALGFRQSAWEPSQGTAVYLFHLPMSRRAILLTKLSTGIGLLLACTLLPILVYGTWAARPRTHPSPFEWSMTGPAFHLWLLLPLAYLGAFASGIRPTRWLGSRLLPLFSLAVPAIYMFAVPAWWLFAFPLLLLVVAALVSDILLEARTRDF